MREVLYSKIGNIGSLCGFLKSDKNIEYLDFINNNIIDISEYNLTLSEKLYYYFNKIESPILCGCGSHKKFIGFKNGYRSTCGNKECFVKIRKETCLERYGVDNPNKLDKIKEISKETILKRYNGKHYMYDKDVISKFKSSMNKNHGVDWAQQNKEINSKSIKTWSDKSIDEIEDIKIKKQNSYLNKTKEELSRIVDKRNLTIENKYGNIDDYHRNIQSKIRKGSREKYGVDHFLKSEEVINKRVNSYKRIKANKIINLMPLNYNFIDKSSNNNLTDYYFNIIHTVCNCEMNITRQLFYKRIMDGEELCLICNPKHGFSKSEKEVLEFIKENYDGIVLENDRKFGIECDIYLPSIKLGIEYNGLYWHSELYKDSKFHLNKTDIFYENDNRLIHIFEDEWLYKRDIVKSRLLNILGESNKIYARKCEIREVDNKSSREFLTSNHIQGFVGSKVKLGLYLNDKLVSIMTFGSLRKNLGYESREGCFELLRFCNILNSSVIGGASKLFKYFIENYNPEYILSYADRRWSIGNLYDKLGFKLINNTCPNYFYIKDNLRINRFNFRKDKLIHQGFDIDKTEKEIMFDRGLYRIYDSGSIKYEYNFE